MTDLFNNLGQAVSGEQFLTSTADNGQEFQTSGSDDTVGSVTVSLDTTAATAGTLTASLYTATDANGLGTLIGTFAAVDNLTLPTGADEDITFTFGPAQLAPNTDYYVVLEDTAANAIGWNETASAAGAGVDGTFYVAGGNAAASSSGTGDTPWLIDVATCYARGTLIATDKGEVAIERLQAGDRVVTVSGDLKPIEWIGHRRIDIARHLRPELVRPVRFEAGALGENLPARDLLVSPEHALWLGEALVPARELINGATIRQEAWSRVEYFHLELESHEILLAQGVPAESYLDCDNRRAFDNAPDSVVSLHPDWRRQAAGRPFASSAQSARLRAQFAARAFALGRNGEMQAYEAEKFERGQVARTNFVRNPRAEGSVPGILGAGGHPPTHWRLMAPEGITIEVAGVGEEAGLPFIDIRFAGRASLGGHCCIHPEPGKAAAARCGQDWTLSGYVRHVAGAYTGVDGVNLYIDESGANGAYLVGQDYPPVLPSVDDLSLQRLEATRRMSRPDVAAITGYVQIKVAARTPIDITLRVAGLQIERGHYASHLILPPPGEIRPASRDEAFFSPNARRKAG